MTIIAGHRPNNAREIRAMLVESRGDGSEVIRTDRVELLEQAIAEGKIGLDPTGTRHSPNARAQKVVTIKALYEAFLGAKALAEMASRPQMAMREQINLLEAPAAVTSTVLPQITRQLIFSEVRRQYDLEANVFTPLVPVIPSEIKGSEVVPSITKIDPDDMGDVQEAQPYPRVGVSEEYFTLPGKSKKGGVIELTREAIFFDRTGMLVDQAREVGGALGGARENAIIDTFIGYTNNYSRNGSATDTYLTSGAYINKATGLPLTDWNDVDTALQLFADILDPNTSEPLAGNMRPKHLVVMPANLMKAQRLLESTQIAEHENASAGTRTTETFSPNPLRALALQLVSSIRLYRRVLLRLESEAAKAKAGWFLGTIENLLAWYECWALSLAQQGGDSDDSFDRDIEAKYKASYYGVCAVREPRSMLRLEDSAWA
jgi:hypothetical protein